MIALGEIVIIGGGCYGSFYLGQLIRAHAAGAISWRRVTVVDRRVDCQAAVTLGALDTGGVVIQEWQPFFDEWLDSAVRELDDRIVPSPLMPHLFADWLTRGAEQRWPTHRVERLAVTEPIGTPFDMLHPTDGNRYISHADWLCPVHCIEPATCPIIRAPRSWEMRRTVEEWAARTNRSSAVFACQHVTHGVGMIEVGPIMAAAELIEQEVAARGRIELAIGSVSSCHGALGLLRVEPNGPVLEREPSALASVLPTDGTE